VLENIAWTVFALFPLSEIVLAIALRSRGRTARSEDRGSIRVLWLAILFGMILANAIQFLPGGRFPLPRPVVVLASLVLAGAGLAIRWTAIITLGRLFTVDVAIHEGHTVMRGGLYHWMRHPSYTGLLLTFLAIGVFSGNWHSVLVLMIPIGLAVWRRVVVEERALLASLGEDYASYCAVTRRFVPGVL